MFEEATDAISDSGEALTTHVPLKSKSKSKTNDDSSKEKKNIRPITASIKQQQIENYRSGRALMVNLHPTHHGGTSFCSIIGRTGGPVASEKHPEISPDFACWYDKNRVGDARYSPHNATRFLATTPVRHHEMDTYLKGMRSHFHMTSWEYDGVDEMQRNVSETNWEHPDLLSVVITREPLSRLLAGGTKLKNWYPGYNTGNLSHAGWWDYATNPKRQQTDNFFLRIIEGTRRPDPATIAMQQKQRKLLDAEEKLRQDKRKRQRRGKRRLKQKRRKAENKTKRRKNEYMYTDDNLPSLDELSGSFNIDENNFKRAVGILDRFTVVLDIACLDDGMDALANLSGLHMPLVTKARELANKHRVRKKNDAFRKLSIRERIGYDDVYEYLLKKHQWDIKLYEYSKTISLVDCNS